MSTKKGLIQLLSGTLGVQLTAFAFYPILSRIYSPKDFGIFGIFTSIVIITGIFSTGQLHLLFPHPDSEEDANHLYFSSISYVIASSIFVSSVIFWNYKQVYELLGSYIYILPLSIIMFALNDINKMWFIRRKDYVQSSIFININRITSNGLKALFPLSIGLIVSELLANLTSTIFFLRRYSASIFSSFDSFNIKVILNNLTKFWKYPTVLAAGSLSQYLIWEYPVFHLGTVFDKSLLGQFVVSNKLTVQTFILATGAFSLVIQNRLIEDLRAGKSITNLFIKVSSFVVITTIPVIFFIHYLGESVFMFVLGEKWKIAGEISVILSPLIFSKVMFGPFYGLFMATRRIEYLSLIRFFQFICLIVFFNYFALKDFRDTIKVLVLMDFIADILAIAVGLKLLIKLKSNSKIIF